MSAPRRPTWLVTATVAAATTLVLAVPLLLPRPGTEAPTSSPAALSAGEHDARPVPGTGAALPPPVEGSPGSPSPRTPSDSPRAEQQPPTGLYTPDLPLGPTADSPAGDTGTPERAAAGYLAAVYEVTADDGAHRHRRAEAWQDVTNPARGRGVSTWDPPPDGASRTVANLDIELAVEAPGRTVLHVRFDLRDDNRVVRTVESFLVLVEQPSGGWLVADDRPHLDPAH
jgi:hypothetical protein